MASSDERSACSGGSVVAVDVVVLVAEGNPECGFQPFTTKF
jgi:hypothetical protein